MTKVITRDLLKSLRAPIEEALKEIGKRYGVELKTGRGLYGDTTGSLKIEIASISEDGTPTSKERESFLQMAKFDESTPDGGYKSLKGLTADHLGKSFKSGGTEYTVIGHKTRARKRPILVEVAGGSKFVFPVEDVAKAFGVFVGNDFE